MVIYDNILIPKRHMVNLGNVQDKLLYVKAKMLSNTAGVAS